MSTSLAQGLQTDWQDWHSARERDLASPHGWLSLTAFHWLPDAPASLPGLPGEFSVQDGDAVLTAAVDHGYVVAETLVPVIGTVRTRVAEAKSLVWLTLGDVVVELALRGGRYAIRTRDPKAATRTAFRGVPAFEIDHKWLLNGQFVAFDAPRRIAVSTARSDLAQHVTGVGTVTLELAGEQYRLIATAGAAGTLNIAFHDATNGRQTAAWRAVATSVPDSDGRVQIDFNRAINLPFAFSDYGTCPAPPAGNILPFAVTAGELAPRRDGRQ